MLRTMLAAIILLGFVHAVAADSIDIGPEVGTPIPQSIALYNPAGTEQKFADLVGAKGAVLVFVRSADWCPYCIQQLRDIQGIDAQLTERGYNVVSISYDAPATLAGFAKKFEITYRLMSDRNSATIDAFGIRDPQYKEGSRAYGVPKPAIFIVDRQGIVRAKLAEEGYKTRPPSQAIIAAVDGLAQP